MCLIVPKFKFRERRPCEHRHLHQVAVEPPKSNASNTRLAIVSTDCAWSIFKQPVLCLRVMISKGALNKSAASTSSTDHTHRVSVIITLPGVCLRLITAVCWRVLPSVWPWHSSKRPGRNRCCKRSWSVILLSSGQGVWGAKVGLVQSWVSAYAWRCVLWGSSPQKPDNCTTSHSDFGSIFTLVFLRASRKHCCRYWCALATDEVTLIEQVMR